MSAFADAEAGIRQLHSHYIDAVWRKDPVAFGQCFTEDGEWRISGMILKGRPQITETIEKILSGAHRILMTFRTPLIELGPDGTATGRTYVTEQCTWKERAANISIGRYYEHFVDEGDRWRFKWRMFQLHYSGPDDFTGTWHEHDDFGPPPGMPPLNAEVPDHASDKWGLNK